MRFDSFTTWSILSMVGFAAVCTAHVQAAHPDRARAMSRPGATVVRAHPPAGRAPITGIGLGVPQNGVLNRILASHFETAQGTDYSTTCGQAASCKGELRGQLQPYAVYVPRKTRPAAGWGLTLLLHSLGANYNQFSGSRNQSQFGERGGGSLVITPAGRGPDGWYYDYAGADTWEAWADVAAHYQLDPDWTSIAGYSMGGYGTYKFATQFPDLFAKAQPTVGPPGLGIWVPPAPPTVGRARTPTRCCRPCATSRF